MWRVGLGVLPGEVVMGIAELISGAQASSVKTVPSMPFSSEEFYRRG